MRVGVDLDLCQGHAMCVVEAPDVFTVPRRGKVTILAERPPADRRADVERAVRYCPTRALTLEEDQEDDRMPAFFRAELDEMVDRWTRENERCERIGDWRPLAEMYTEDATYGWNVGPEQDFMAVGRAEIRDLALGQEMVGLEGWTYPYQRFVIDDQQGAVIGFWKQIATGSRPDGTAYEVPGIGGSWFRYGGNWQWSWQRDFFDFGNVSFLYMEMMRNGALSDGMLRRINRAVSGERQPGYFRRGQAPVPIW